MSIIESTRSIVEQLRQSARVESVYGEPISVGEKTVVPVARVAYGFGGGYGSGGPRGESDSNSEEREESGSGAGGGGGASATPVGALEISTDETRFVRYRNRNRKTEALTFAAGVLVGFLLKRRR